MNLSVIIPLKNESQSLQALYNEIKGALGSNINYEIIFIDDGSTDNSYETLKKLQNGDKRIKIMTIKAQGAKN